MGRYDIYLELTSSTFGDAAYTFPASADSIAHDLVLVNIDGTNAVDGSVRYLDASDSSTAKSLLVEAEVLAGDAAEVIRKPRYFGPGDVLQGLASANNDLVLQGWYETFDETT